MPAEKPFEPTPQRLARARREGDLPRANDAVVFGALAGGSLGLVLAGPPLVALGRAALVAAAGGGAPGWLGLAAPLALLPALGAAAGAVLAFVAVHGGVTLRAPRLQLDRLSPGKGLRRMLSRESAYGIARALAAGAALAAALVPAARDALAAAATTASPVRLAASFRDAGARVLATALVAAAALGALDLALGRLAWRKKLRLSHAELKRELREGEGDPMLRGRRRRAHGALVRGSLARLPEASFVVVNPVHVAVALTYDPPDVPVPRVVVRARDVLALEAKRRAAELGIPVVTEPALARALFATTEDGAYVPRELYEPLARIVAAILYAKR